MPSLNLPLNQKIELGGEQKGSIRDFFLNNVTSSLSLEFEKLPLEEVQYYFKGSDSKGNIFRYGLTSVNGEVYLFKTEKGLPSIESEWIDLQCVV